MGLEDESFQLNLNRVYFLALLVVSSGLALIVVFDIPVYLKRTHTASSIRKRDMLFVLQTKLYI
jgi:hypothetical protein